MSLIYKGTFYYGPLNESIFYCLMEVLFVLFIRVLITTALLNKSMFYYGPA